MDTVIDRISEIEAAAGAIMDEANVRKKEFARQMAEKTAAFDRQMEEETAARIRRVQEAMEADMTKKLSMQKADSDELLRRIEENYETQHEAYTEALFKAMIKE